jgi:hypothetical protein
MAKLEWRWTVPSGEAVEARLERGIESVFLAARLVSRSPAAGNPQGHAFEVGGKSAWILVDGAEIAPTAAPPPVVLTPVSPEAATRPTFSRQHILAAAGVVAVGIYFGVIGAHSPGAAWDRLMANNTPFGDSHMSADKALGARYPIDFTIAQAGDGWILVTRDGHKNEFVACQMMVKPAEGVEAGDPVPSVLERALGVGGKYEQQSTEPVTCHGEDGTRAEGVIEKNGDRTRVVSCAFEKYGYRYVVAYGVAEERVYQDEPLIQRVAGAVVLVNPRTLPFFALGRGPFGFGRR